MSDGQHSYNTWQTAASPQPPSRAEHRQCVPASKVFVTAHHTDTLPHPSRAPCNPQHVLASIRRNRVSMMGVARAQGIDYAEVQVGWQYNTGA